MITFDFRYGITPLGTVQVGHKVLFIHKDDALACAIAESHGFKVEEFTYGLECGIHEWTIEWDEGPIPDKVLILLDELMEVGYKIQADGVHREIMTHDK